MIEFGAFDGYYSHDPSAIPVVQEIEKIQEVIRTTFGDQVEVTFLPYEGTRSLMGGGRVDAPTPAQLTAAVQDFNQAGISFMVALNGGRGLPRNAEIDLMSYRLDTERRILDTLAEYGAVNNVTNHVTVVHDGLWEVIKRDYPSVSTTASCIRFVGGKEGEFKGREEYTEAFNRFDAVVPLNQHTTPQFLAEWKAFATKMMPLLNSKCDIENTMQCLVHYLYLEGARLPEGLTWTKADSRVQGYVTLPNPDFGPRRGCSEKMDGQLWARTSHLTELIRWGVHQFKIGRDPLGDPLNVGRLIAFIKLFLETPVEAPAL